MKVLIISQEYPPRTGGAGVVAKQNAEGLSALGHNVTVITREWGGGNGGTNLKVIGVGGVRKLWPFYMAKELKGLSVDDYDSIILNDVGAALVFVTFFRGKRYYYKTILYLHGGEVQTIFQRPKGYLKWTRFLNRYISLVQSCKRVIAVSQYMKVYFKENFPAPIDEKKIAVVYAGVENKIFREVKSTVRKEIGIAQDKLLLISVGRIIKEKGFPKMLSIFEKAWKKNPALCWLVIGDGPYLTDLKREAAISNAGGSIHFLGRVDREKLPSYYSVADLFWLLSERESFGLVYVEAQMCGCSAMGPAKYGVKEAINHGKSGFLVRSDKECINILSSGCFTEFERTSVVSFASKFCLDKQVEKLERLL